MSKLNGANNSDENFLFKIKEKMLPIVKPYGPIYYVRITALLANGAFDAIAPYHNTAKAIYSTIPKRPEIERTVQNKNIAIAYASLRILNKLLPGARFVWENELRLAGLNPEDISTDLTTPIGIGNVVAEMVLNVRMNDGMNQEDNDKSYHKQKYFNSISYSPKNTPYEITFPDNWQPLIREVSYGEYAAQEHIVPQYGNVVPYSLENVDSFKATVPTRSKVANIEGYVDQVQQILLESYTLDDRKKMVAEYFDDKTWSLDGTVESIINQNKLDLDEYVFLHMAVKIALFDAGIVAWKEKIKFDCVRPITAIKYLYENTTLKAWGGPGVGPVEDMKGKDWDSYLYTGPHSEYPSGTTCFCAAQAQALRRYFNSENMNHSIAFPRGSSVIEPWKTPATDTSITFNTYDEFVHICGLSRVYGGVHFHSSANEAAKLCKPVGDAAYDFVYAQVNGDVEANEATWTLNDEDRFKILLNMP